MFLMLLVTGAAVFKFSGDLSIIDALYLTIVSASTVGYGEYLLLAAAAAAAGYCLLLLPAASCCLPLLTSFYCCCSVALHDMTLQSTRYGISRHHTASRCSCTLCILFDNLLFFVPYRVILFRLTPIPAQFQSLK